MSVRYRTHTHSGFYDRYMQSRAWRRKRRRKLRRTGGRCEACGLRGRLEVHHRTYERLGHERMGDLRVVCVHHHASITRKHDQGMPLAAATDAVVTRPVVHWWDR